MESQPKGEALKANEIKFLEFVKHASKFVIPIYQRTYSWDEKQCEQLFNDILHAGADDDIKLHFVGSIVYIQDGISAVMNSAWQVIDGQQRLTTMTLLLEALSRLLPETEQVVTGFSANRVRNNYLSNSDEDGPDQFKLHLTATDDTTLKAILKNTDKISWPQNPSIKILNNFEYFVRRISPANMETLCKGIFKLAIVHISLERGIDNPQLIFESMNSTGKELSQADLIRNYILMGLDQELQSSLYDEHWRPMELAFGQEAYASKFDNFIRYYLTVVSGSAPKVNEVYENFKVYANKNFGGEQGVSRLVREIHKYANYYCAIGLGAESNDLLKSAFNDLITDLDFSVTFPVLLKLYDFFDAALISIEDFEKSVRAIESYVFRRLIVGIPTSSLNKTFAALPNLMKPEAVYESLLANLVSLQTYKRFPDDEEFARIFQEKDLYNISSRTYWLRKLENHGRTKELVVVENLTIEHIMPQNSDPLPQWKSDLGPDWQSIQSRYLHTLGNLTLTGYNSEYSDKPFAEKRDMPEIGLKFSPLNLNLGLGAFEIWEESAIKERATKLAKLAVNVWAKPILSDANLAEYAPKPSFIEKAEYSIADHEYLHRDETREIYEALETEILALDPNVTIEFKKLYIAFKLQTNFVDVIPQAKALLLSINMDFNDIDDPFGKARDVTNISRWGNGDVELKIESLDEIQYSLGLIRQALERQLV